MRGQGSIFDLMGDDDGGGPATVARAHPPVSALEWDRDELLRREKEVLGLYVSSHPLTPLRDQLARQVDAPLREFAESRDGQVVTVGGIVAGVRQLVTKKGDTDGVRPSSTTPPTRSRWSCSRRRWETARDDAQARRIVLVKGRVDRKSEGEVQADRDRGDAVRGGRRRRCGQAAGRCPARRRRR